MFNKDEVRALLVICEKTIALEEKIKDKKGKGDIMLNDKDGKPLKVGGVSTVGPAFSMVTSLLSCIAFSIAADSLKQDKTIIKKIKQDKTIIKKEK